MSAVWVNASRLQERLRFTGTRACKFGFSFVWQDDDLNYGHRTGERDPDKHC